MAAGTARMASGHIRLFGSLVVEGAFERAYLGAVNRRIDELSGRRTVFSTAAHELAHHALAINEANNTGMTAVLDALALLVHYEQFTPADLLPSFAGDAASPAMIFIPKYRSDSVPRLPSWATRDVAGMLSEVWHNSSATEAVNAIHTRPQVTLRLSDDIGSLLADVLAALLRLRDVMLAMARLCGVEIWMLRRERSHVLARIGRLPDIRAFGLIIIAVCRHYGHRSEPNDHASLFFRRHLVPMGSCPPV
jgi:hypothetical protein